MSTEISGSIKTNIVIDSEVYDVQLAIPTGRPGLTAPYKLEIYSETVQKATPIGDPVPMLVWMEASYNDKSAATAPDNAYLELSPPASILPTVNGEESGTTAFAIKSLSISFATGEYVTTAPTDGPKGSKPAS